MLTMQQVKEIASAIHVHWSNLILQSITEQNEKINSPMDVIWGSEELSKKYKELEKDSAIATMIPEYIVNLFAALAMVEMESFDSVVMGLKATCGLQATNNYLKNLHETPTYPALINFEFDEMLQILLGCDILLHLPQSTLEKFPFANEARNYIRNCLDNHFLFTKMTATSPSLFKPANPSAQAKTEEKQYWEALLTRTLKSPNLLFRAIAEDASVEEIKEILAKNPKLVFETDEEKNTALHLMVLSDSSDMEDIVSLLCIHNKAMKTQKNSHGMTPSSLNDKLGMSDKMTRNLSC